MAKKWIQAANMEEGSFTAKAQSAGKGVQEYAKEKAKAKGKLGKQARLAMTFRKLGKKKRKKSKRGAIAGMLGKAYKKTA